jgi:hypothetical protein
MSRQTRLALFFVGLALMCLSLTALAYVFWPIDDLRLQATLAPSLFVAP